MEKIIFGRFIKNTDFRGFSVQNTTLLFHEIQRIEINQIGQKNIGILTNRNNHLKILKNEYFG